MTAPATTVWDARTSELGEGPRWVGGRLVYVDILSGLLLDVGTEPGGTARTLATLPLPLGAVAPTASGGWIAAAGDGIALLADDGTPSWLGRPESDGRIPTRMNDGCADPHGRFWATSMAYDATTPAGSLYRVDRDGTIHRVLSGLIVGNGPAFDESGSLLYVADSAAGRIDRCTVDIDTGEITARRPFVEVRDASPDGMFVDSSGCLWSAMWGRGVVRRYSPKGLLDLEFAVPATQPSSLCPAGDWLAVTTARTGLSNPAENDGQVLALARRVEAPPTAEFVHRPS